MTVDGARSCAIERSGGPRQDIVKNHRDGSITSTKGGMPTPIANSSRCWPPRPIIMMPWRRRHTNATTFV